MTARTRPVELNHLEAMGICMSLMREGQDDGLSTPQQDALGKVQDVLSLLLDDLGRPRLGGEGDAVAGSPPGPVGAEPNRTPSRGRSDG